MIERETVFVLGAGASKPYGLPVGSDLRKDIIKGLEPNGELRKEVFLVLDGLQSDDLTDFASRLLATKTPSIDSFIRKNSRHDLIARISIAARLLHDEDGRVVDNAGDWYEDLWHFMEKAESFEQNKLRVLTFNYDRSFEVYFTRRLAQLDPDWENPDFEAVKSVVHPLHIHGSLGEDVEFGGIIQENRMSPMLIQEASRGSKILATDRTSRPAYHEAQTVLARAEVICFLGFAYHRDNMYRLMPEKLQKDVQIFGTTFKMVARDIRYPKGQLERLAREAGGSAKVELLPVDCRELLAEHVTY